MRNRGLSLGARSGEPHDLGLENHPPQHPLPALGRIAALAVECSVCPLVFDRCRAFRIARSARRVSTSFLAIATTYATLGCASRNVKTSGPANPPSSRTRMRAWGNASRTRARRRFKMPMAPAFADALPGRSTAVTRVLLRLVVEAEKADDRQIAPRIVMAVPEGQLLRAVGRVVGRVQIDRDALRPPVQPASVPRDHRVGQRRAHPVQRPWHRRHSRTGRASVARPRPRPRADRGPAAVCGWDRARAGPRHWHPRSHTRCRTRAAPAGRRARARPSRAGADPPCTRRGARSSPGADRRPGGGCAPPSELPCR